MKADDPNTVAPTGGVPDGVIADPLPDPPKHNATAQDTLVDGLQRAGQAIAQGAQVAKDGIISAGQKTKEYVEQSENIQKGVTKIKEGGEKVKEKVKEGWEKAKENEKFAKVVDGTTTAVTKTVDKTKEITTKTVDKTKEITQKVRDSDKTKAVVAGAEKTKKKAGEIWEAGKGSLTKIKNKVGENFRGNAQETLLQREESAKKWKDMKIRGAEEMTVGARKEYTTNYFIEKGTLMRWSFRVQEHDIGFGVRVRKMQDGGSIEEDVLPVEKFDNVDTIEGSWVADEDRTMVLVFDNSYSMVRSKTVSFLVGTEAPGGGAEAAEQQVDPAASA